MAPRRGERAKIGLFFHVCNEKALRSSAPQGAAERREPRRAAALCGAKRRHRRGSLAAAQKCHFREWPVAGFSFLPLILAVFDPF